MLKNKYFVAILVLSVIIVLTVAVYLQRKSIDTFNDTAGLISFDYPDGLEVSQLEIETNIDNVNTVAITETYNYKIINQQDKNTLITIENKFIDYTKALGGSDNCEFGYYKFDDSMQDDFVSLTTVGDTEFILERATGVVYEMTEDGYSDTLYEFNDREYPLCREVRITLVTVEKENLDALKVILDSIEVQ